MALDRSLRKRVYRHLDAAYCRGAFDTTGSLCGLDADAIADGIAAEWDGENRGKLEFIPGTSPLDAETLLPHVEAWLANNAAGS